jgi:hypothetical protein
MAQPFAEHRQRLTGLRRILNQAEGQRLVLVDRQDKLTREVGLAKGRILLQPKVDEFLEGLQYEAHQKSVGRYEALLSAISKDVLETSKPIGLDLYTERGLPALDIFVNAGEGQREDIVDGSGGSLTNVISLGLRMISTVRSRMRQFAAFDEPDCWVAPHRVPRFYGVLGQMSKKMALQCLVISHHDITLLDPTFQVTRVYVEQDGTVAAALVPNENAPQWADEAQPGLRHIKLMDYQSHSDTTLHLGPGCNAIVGDNHIGKSVLVRAIRAVAYGEVSDADIRHGKKGLTVEIGLENNTTLRFSRVKGRNPINEWALVDANDEPITDKATNTVYQSGAPRGKVPDWVEEKLGIARVDSLDIQVAHQKYPVFLLGEPSSRRAAVLSIGRESGYIQSMITKHKENVTKDKATIRNGEKELADIKEKLERLEKVPELLTAIEACNAELEALEVDHGNTAMLEAQLVTLDSLIVQCDVAAQTMEVLKGIPTFPVEVEQRLIENEEVLAYGRKLKGLTKDKNEAEAMSGALASLPKALPALLPTEELGEIVVRFDEASTEQAIAAARHEAFRTLPKAAPMLLPTDELAEVVVRFDDAWLAREVAAARHDTLATLPQMPVLHDIAAMAKLITAYDKAQAERDKVAAQHNAIAKEMEEVRKEHRKLVEQMGNVCDRCGQHVDADMLLAHDHEDAA